MAQKDRKQALSDLSLEVFRLTARLNSLADQLSREAGLTAARWQVLGALAASSEPLSVSEIARRMGLQRQSVQRTADALSKQGLIEYAPNPKHQRAKLALVTQSGEAALATMDDNRDRWADELKDHLELAKLIQATETLQALRDMIDCSPPSDNSS